MSVVVITPAASAVAIVDAKRHLRRDDQDDDVMIATYLAAAQGELDGPDGWLGRSLGLQTLEWSRPGFLGLDCEVPPCPPFVDTVSITYRDAAGFWQTLPTLSYEIDVVGRVALLPGHNWPATWTGGWSGLDTVRVRYRSGYPDIPASGEGENAPPARSTLPPSIKAAILLMVGDLYDDRSGKTAANLVQNPTVARLLAPFRVYA